MNFPWHSEDVNKPQNRVLNFAKFSKQCFGNVLEDLRTMVPQILPFAHNIPLASYTYCEIHLLMGSGDWRYIIAGHFDPFPFVPDGHSNLIQ